MDSSLSNRILNHIREMISVGDGGFTGDSAPEGPTAGYDPLMKMKKRKNGKVDLRKVPSSHRKWIK
jgi:hypothetical protein